MELLEPVQMSLVYWFLKGLDALCRFSAILYKGDTFCDFLFGFLHA